MNREFISLPHSSLWTRRISSFLDKGQPPVPGDLHLGGLAQVREGGHAVQVAAIHLQGHFIQGKAVGLLKGDDGCEKRLRRCRLVYAGHDWLIGTGYSE